MTRVFAMWFGGHPMSAVRESGLASLADNGLDVVLLRDEDVDAWVLPEHPLLPGYYLLSAIQRSDYLRAYLLHHHGGAYADIKPQAGSWRPALDAFDADPSAMALGYEVERWEVANLGVSHLPRYQPWRVRWWGYRGMQLVHSRIIGGGAVVARPGTAFTRHWLAFVERRVQRITPLLQQHPGAYVKERKGDVNDGVESQYPSYWSYVGPDTLQVSALRHNRHIHRTLPRPVTEDALYQDPRPGGTSGPRDLTRERWSRGQPPNGQG